MKKSQTYSLLIWRQFKKQRFALAGLILILLLFAAAIFAPVIANSLPIVMYKDGRVSFPALDLPSDMKDINFKKENAEKNIFMIFPPIPFGPTEYNLSEILEAPSTAHLFGTDGEGRDVASQLVWGTRISLSVGIIAVTIAVIIGVILGALAGYFGGIVDIVISRVIEVMMCFPTLFLILAVLAFVGPSLYNVMAVIGLTGWTSIARLTRGECLKLRSRGFVAAARAVGAKNSRIIFRHVLPSAISPVLVTSAFGIASAILIEASLSFLGFGSPPSTPSWGRILSQAQEVMDIAWWLTLAPGFAIFLTVTAYNLVGEGLRDAIDPNMKI